MNLVLIGYRGTGKSTLADLLHERLMLPVYHCDEMLEARFEMRIAEFVVRYGWDEFRIEEEILLEELCQLDRIIIDTGGGAVTRQANRQNLKANSLVVWLQASVQSIAHYIARDKNRPSLTGSQSSVEEIEEMLRQRTPWYQSLADITVNTEKNSLEHCADQILIEWKKRYETLETG